MRDAEQAALKRGISEDALMEEAGRGVAEAVDQFFSRPGTLVLFAGKGHNAGDAFVAARHLLDAGWRVCGRLTFGAAECRPLAHRKWEMIRERVLDAVPASGPLVLLDGLLGIGTGGELRDPIRSACREMNALRLERHAHTVAVDLPSGLDADSGICAPDAVVADITCTIAMAKKGLLEQTALNHVGRLAVVPVPALELPTAGEADRVLTPRGLRGALPARRAFATHKGGVGRIGILAGSRGLVGAARLCSAAAIRGGAGLVTLFVPEDIYEISATSAIPEVMVRPVNTYDEVWKMDFNVLAIGPGLGPHASREIQSFILTDPRPAVLDADALNILASKHTGILAKCKAPRLLTPHPGEMRRLLESWKPDYVTLSRREQAERFTETFPVTLLYKGARTLIKAPGQPLSYNPTGHPGMATAGLGDVLTGLCAALLGQGCVPFDAACVGSWILGRAAEIAIFNRAESAESLCASDVLANLGAAFLSLRNGDF
jgi:NAD(P)H-hydrate epimerase